jgi:flagellar hook-basal body complex protein FliE
MSIGPIAAAVMPVMPALPSMSAGTSAASAAGTDASAAAGSSGSFSNALSAGLDNLQQLQSTADGLAVQAADGTLTNVHDYMIAATKASVATDLTVAVRNKAVDAFNEILRMQV